MKKRLTTLAITSLMASAMFMPVANAADYIIDNNVKSSNDIKHNYNLFISNLKSLKGIINKYKYI